MSCTAVPRVLLAAALGLTACSDAASGAGNQAAVRSGDATACRGDVVDVVVSVGAWRDLVETLGGQCATVTTVLSSPAVDPHDYEPTTADLAAFTGAALVVLNGAGYDSWAADALGTLDEQPAVVDAAAVAGRGDDPHLWYDIVTVQRTATAVTMALSALSPGAADHFATQATAWQDELDPYFAELATLQASAGHRTYAATESVFDGTAAAIGLTDVTPEGYRSAAGNDAEPAPGDLAAFQIALADGGVDVLIVNPQTTGSVPEQLRAAAEDAGVPVVEVTESAPDDDGSFVTWQLGQLRQLARALGEDR